MGEGIVVRDQRERLAEGVDVVEEQLECVQVARRVGVVAVEGGGEGAGEWAGWRDGAVVVDGPGG